jgi:hypothetical protein
MMSAGTNDFLDEVEKPTAFNLVVDTIERLPPNHGLITACPGIPCHPIR